jgi:hypothetical protein
MSRNFVENGLNIHYADSDFGIFDIITGDQEQ